MIVIDTIDQALALLEAEVQEAGADFVYQPPGREDGSSSMCAYHHQGKPSCLIARVFVKAGATIDDLKVFDTHGSVGNLALQGLLDSIPESVVRVLDAAQWQQDRQNTWGSALQAAQEQAAHERGEARV